jgi:hypothetical protein
MSGLRLLESLFIEGLIGVHSDYESESVYFCPCCALHFSVAIRTSKGG